MSLPKDEEILVCKRAGAAWAMRVYNQIYRLLGGRSPQQAQQAGLKAEKFWPFPRPPEDARGVCAELVVDGRVPREHETELAGVIHRAAAARYDELCAIGNPTAPAGSSSLDHFAERER